MNSVPIDASEILVLSCPECQYNTLKVSSLESHLQQHDCRIQVKLHKCKQCGMVTNCENLIDEHVEIWHPGKGVKENIAVVFDEAYNKEKPAGGSKKAKAEPVVMRNSLTSLPTINLLQLMNMARGPVEINLPGVYRLDHTKDNVHARISYLPGFISKTMGDQMLQKLKDELSWKQLTTKTRDGDKTEPRLTCYVGPDFEWCGNKFHDCDEWHSKLQELKSLVEQASGRTFNAAICYMFRNGRDSVGWHCEKEKELGEHPYIAAVNLGQGRFHEFNRKNRQDRYVRVGVGHGDLLITDGALEDLWLHRIPKDSTVRRTSFIFSFRNVTPKQNSEDTPMKDEQAS